MSLDLQAISGSWSVTQSACRYMIKVTQQCIIGVFLKLLLRSLLEYAREEKRLVQILNRLVSIFKICGFRNSVLKNFGHFFQNSP